MSMTPVAKLSLFAVTFIVLLFFTGPMLYAFQWQLAHGRDVTLNGLTLHLDRGWIVTHNAIVRVPDNLFFGDAADNFISVNPVLNCPQPQVTARMFASLRSAFETRYMQPAVSTRIHLGDDYLSCFEVHSQASSPMTDTECIAPSAQRTIEIHSTATDRSDAIHMLQSAHETQPCKP
jgi:hypothetical protein